MKHDPSNCECQKVFALLSAYLDREVTCECCAEIEQHLANCPPCIEFLDSLKRSIEVCKDCGPCEEPAPLSAAQRDELFAAYQKCMNRRGAEDAERTS